MAQMVKDLLQVLSLCHKYPLEKTMATQSNILGEFHEQGYSPWACKESDMTEPVTFLQWYASILMISTKSVNQIKKIFEV